MAVSTLDEPTAPRTGQRHHSASDS